MATYTTSTETTGRLDTRELGQGVVVYRYRTITIRKSKRSVSATEKVTVDDVTVEGFTSRAGLKKFLDGAGEMPRYDKVKYPVLVGPEGLEHLRQYGWPSTSKQPAFPEPSKTPYTHLEQGASPDGIVIFDGGSDAVYDLQGNVVACAITFSYLSGFMDDARYDLKKVVEILSKRDDIVFMDDKGNDRDPTRYDVVVPAPYYANDDRSAILTFRWVPPTDAYRAMYEKCLSYGKKNAPLTERHRAIFDLDLLGLRAGGAALYDDYYKRTEVERDCEEDE